MLNRKLLEIIQRLNPSDCKRLRLFLLSPYFNAGSRAEAIVKTYDLILKYNADEKAPRLQKEYVFKKIFPGQQFEPNVKGPLDMITSDLLNLVRLFMQQTTWENQSDETSEGLVMAKFYRQHGLEDRFWQTMEQTKLAHENSVQRDVEYYYRKFRITEEELHFQSSYNTIDNEGNLDEFQDSLNQYVVSLKLGYIAFFAYQQRFSAIKLSPPSIIDKLIYSLPEEEAKFNTPINQIYQIIIKIIKNEGIDQDYELLEKLLHENHHLIDLERSRNLMSYLRSLWVHRYIQGGGQNVSRYIFDLYRDHLTHGFFYFNNSISLNAFYNLCIIALKVGETDWVSEFLNTHPPERIYGTRYPQEVHNLCKAEYFFSIKDYLTAEQILEYKLFETSHLSISADVLLIKIYVETQSELLETRMAALYKKVKRSKFTEDKKDLYLNFLSKLSKLIKLGPFPEHAKRSKMIEEIKGIPNMASRDWLLAKLAS